MTDYGYSDSCDLIVWANTVPCRFFGYQWATHRTLDILIIKCDGLSFFVALISESPLFLFQSLWISEMAAFCSNMLHDWLHEIAAPLWDRRITWLSILAVPCSKYQHELTCILSLPSEDSTTLPPLRLTLFKQMFEIRQVSFFPNRTWKFTNSSIIT